jgi:hypothetical protein
LKEKTKKKIKKKKATIKRMITIFNIKKQNQIERDEIEKKNLKKNPKQRKTNKNKEDYN